MIASIFQQWPDFFPKLLPGLWVTLKLTFASLGVGIPCGLALAVAGSTKRRLARWPIVVFVELGRGLPALVLLYLVYFGLPKAGLTLTAFVSATVALGAATAAYTSEIFRAGLEAVPAGQREAARAVGLSRWQELRLVVLPLAVRSVIPPLIGFGVLLYQGTSLAFVITVPELLSRAYQEATITFQFMSALVLVGVMYAAISLTVTLLVGGSVKTRPSPPL